MKFSSQITAFTTTCVVLAACLVLAGGAWTFRQLAFNQQQHQLAAVVELLDSQLSVQPDTPEFAQWLPNWLKAHNIQVLEVANRGGAIYTFRDLAYSGNTESLVAYSYPLQTHAQFLVTIWVERPFKLLTYEPEALGGIGGGVLVVFLGLFAVNRWMRRLLRGAELLEARGNRILAGHLHDTRKSRSQEWPNAASKALEQVIEELLEARKERSRFDKIIRHNAFVDELTQLANRTHFLNQLEAEIMATDDHSGAVILLYLRGMDDVNYQHARSEGDALLQQCAREVVRYMQRYVDAKLARYSGDAFSLLLPMVTLEEAEGVAAGLLKLLERIVLPESADADDFYYMGVAGYQYGDDPQWVIEEAESALRSAQMQRHNGWYVVPRKLEASFTGTGSVRWRTTLQNALENNAIFFEKQGVFDQQGKLEAEELLARIYDSVSRIVHAAVFMPWVEKTGMQQSFDERTLNFAMEQLKISSVPLSINLNVSSVISQQGMQKLLQWVFTVSEKESQKLILEFPEQQISSLNDTEMLRLKALNRKGVRMAVEQAGQQVVSTQYLSELDIAYLKLHPSLVRDIQLRQVNRLAVSSLIACCSGRTEVVAVGVERKEEWRVLQRLGVHHGQGFWFSKPEPIV